MYRGRLWTMHQFAGLGGAEDNNARFHYLMEHGETGLTAYRRKRSSGNEDFRTNISWKFSSNLLLNFCHKK